MASKGADAGAMRTPVWFENRSTSNLVAIGVGPSNVVKPTRSDERTSTQPGTDIYTENIPSYYTDSVRRRFVLVALLIITIYL